MVFRSPALALFPALLTLASLAFPAESDLFQQKIRPLLEKKCLNCHNAQDLKGGLSLESERQFRQGGESGAVVSSEHPEKSWLLEQVTPVDGKAAMPKGGEPLSPEELAALRNWLQQGAPWPEGLTLIPPVWWSLRPLQTVAVPVLNEDCLTTAGTPYLVRTPIDAFVLEQLGRRGLRPAPEADRPTLIRRVTFDLIGLPPTPEEVAQFVADRDPFAYERLVDRLLASPHYGERWARHWLDVVKYADTCGYDKDKPRPNAWPYRDYVIRSFNEDKPYSRFVEEQVAGDILFPGAPDGILGLGFIAAGPWDHIGHVEVPEAKIDGKIARSLDRDEMVTNTLNTFCSATVQCARCHDHKFDPFRQQHYYGLQAVFAAVDRADRPYDLDPEVEQERHSLEQQLQTPRQEMAELKESLKREGGGRLEDLNRKLRDLALAMAPRSKDPRFGYHSAISSEQQTTKWVQIDLGRLVEVTRVVLRPCHDDYAGIGAGFGFPERLRVEAAADVRSLAAEAAEGLPPRILLASPRPSDAPNPLLAPVEFTAPGEPVRYLRVTATVLAERKADYIFSLAEIQAFDAAGQNVALGAAVDALDSIEAPVRWGKQNLTDGIWASTGDEQSAREYADVARERAELLGGGQMAQRIRRQQELTDAVQSLEKKLAALPQGKMVYAAATHFRPQGSFQPTLGKPRAVQILHRGNVQDPREDALPGALPVIPGVPVEFDLPAEHQEGERRAALAQWLTRTDNPLTWRSIVNRIWQYHFGEGLVATPNDFGRMGQEPTHPELLDWLAVQFRDHGQSFKQLHRMIVISSVYRQAAAHDAANAALDGSNQFLWRMNRRRLEAEEIRDAILAVSGTLQRDQGGPGYYLFVLEKPEHSPHYEYEKFDPADPASHRRSVYRFIVRSQPDPFMTTLDCADSSQSTPRRNETVTALQALALLNNRFNLLMARRFADRLTEEAAGLEDQVEQGFQLVTGRKPTAGELQELQHFAEEFGLENLCRVLFNLNEFVYVD